MGTVLNIYVAPASRGHLSYGGTYPPSQYSAQCWCRRMGTEEAPGPATDAVELDLAGLSGLDAAQVDAGLGRPHGRHLDVKQRGRPHDGHLRHRRWHHHIGNGRRRRCLHRGVRCTYLTPSCCRNRIFMFCISASDHWKNISTKKAILSWHSREISDIKGTGVERKERTRSRRLGGSLSRSSFLSLRRLNDRRCLQHCVLLRILQRCARQQHLNRPFAIPASEHKHLPSLQRASPIPNKLAVFLLPGSSKRRAQGSLNIFLTPVLCLPLMLSVEGVLHDGVVCNALLRAFPGNGKRSSHNIVSSLQVLTTPWLAAGKLRHSSTQQLPQIGRTTQMAIDQIYSCLPPRISSARHGRNKMASAFKMQLTHLISVCYHQKAQVKLLAHADQVICLFSAPVLILGHHVCPLLVIIIVHHHL